MPCTFCNASAICFVDTEPNKRPPSPDFAFSSTVSASTFSFNACASANSAAAFLASNFFCPSIWLKACAFASAA